MQELRDGRYVVVRVLGEGAQASTFEAVDKLEGRLVAIKRFALRVAKQWKDVELAEREARVLASLSHPRLPAYVEHFEEGGALYLVMERIEGVSLSDHVKKGGTWREDDVVRLLEQASMVLAYLHSRTPPIIHRDLKPGNVIRKPDGSFAFVDFGAVRDRLKPEGGSTVVGTFGYMAPEQFQGRAVPASDVYAIGATALWMLTGQQPEDLPHKGLAIDVPAALGPRAKPMLVGLLGSMLEPDPDKRAQSLGPLLAGFEPSRPRPAPPPEASSTPEPAPVSPSGGSSAEEVFDRWANAFRRFLFLFWVFAAVAWWILPFRSAFGFTIGLALLTFVTRHVIPPRAERTRRRIPRYERPPAERGPVVRIHGAEEAMKARVALQEATSEAEDGDETALEKRSGGRAR